MLLTRRQAVESACDLLLSQTQGIRNRHPFYHLRKHGAAGERRRTTVSEKPRGFDAAIAKEQTEPQAITADRVHLFTNGICIREFANVSRVGYVVFEGVGV